LTVESSVLTGVKMAGLEAPIRSKGIYWSHFSILNENL
jgi:hypothetical protein